MILCCTLHYCIFLLCLYLAFSFSSHLSFSYSTLSALSGISAQGTNLIATVTVTPNENCNEGSGTVQTMMCNNVGSGTGLIVSCGNGTSSSTWNLKIFQSETCAGNPYVNFDGEGSSCQSLNFNSAFAKVICQSSSAVSDVFQSSIFILIGAIIVSFSMYRFN